MESKNDSKTVTITERKQTQRKNKLVFTSGDRKQRQYTSRGIRATNYSVQFSRSVVSDTLWPHGLQHERLPCPSPTPRVYSNSCPSSRWCHPTISSSAFNLSQHQGFSNESILHLRWPKYWSFSFTINPSNEYSGLISFRMDWLDLLAVQGDALESSTPDRKSVV